MAIERAEISRDEDLLLEKLIAARQQILSEVRKVIIAQEEVVDQVLISLFVGGHSLVTGVPGLAKTLLIHTVANVLDLGFKRIQFTPDLMPSDITGTEIIEEDRSTGHRKLEFMKGPLFANIILADEINRTPPKTQAALLEAMQEGNVTVQGTTYQLPKPFYVLATQNPIEMEGTYPLPEAQLDRFMFNIQIGYLSEDDEVAVVNQTTSVQDYSFEKNVTGTNILEFQRLVRRVPVAEAATLCSGHECKPSTSSTSPDFIRKGELGAR
jgi:MoxR-like ATPase